MLEQSVAGVSAHANWIRGEAERLRAQWLHLSGSIRQISERTSKPERCCFRFFLSGFGEYYKKNWDAARQHFDQAFELTVSPSGASRKKR
jgi:hypothetical protein